MMLTGTPIKNRLLYVFDLDGVVYRGHEPQPGAADTILTLRDRGNIIRFFTNNSSMSRYAYSEKLGSMGIPTPIDDIMTSSYATALYLLEKGARDKYIYKIGEKGIADEIASAGLEILPDDTDKDADFVVVGIDRKFTYAKLTRAQQAILNGAEFIATNADATFPVEGGGLRPGGGCMVAAVQTATSVEPFVIGKPSLYAFNKILEMTQMSADRTIMVGDRLETDVLVGNRGGAHTVLVLTGVSTLDEAKDAQGDLKPDRIINTLPELLG